MFYSGIALGVIMSILLFKLYQNIEPIDKGLTLYFLIMPSVLFAIAPFHIWQALRDISKLCLGISIPVSILTIATSTWWVAPVVLSHFGIGYYYLSRRRIAKEKEICQTCPEFHLRFQGRCSGYQLIREREVILQSRNRLGDPIDPLVRTSRLQWDETRLTKLEKE